VLYVGRLAEHKGIEELIDAVAYLQPHPRLIICGPGDIKPYWQRAQALGLKIDQDIIFTTPGDPDKLLLYRESAVLVHPSRHEGFGLPPLEALYLGCPVIVRATPHNMWLLQDAALYFNGPGELAQALLIALNKPEEMKRRAASGHELVTGLFNLARATHDLGEAIHEAIRVFCGQQMRAHPENASTIFDLDHRRNWFFRAQYFDPTWARHWRAQHFIEELRKAKVERVLDLGCGPVYPTIFALNGFFVIAYDISNECLRQAMRVAEAHGVKLKIVPWQGKAQELPYAEGELEAVVLGEILEHVPDPDRVLAEAYRVVKVGGVVVASTPIGHHHWDPLHIASEDGGWSDEGMAKLLAPYDHEGQVITFERIAEEGQEPSCFLFTIKKRAPMSFEISAGANAQPRA